MFQKDHEKSNQIKSNQIKSNQIKSNQIKSNQIKSNQIKIKSNQIKSNQIKSNQIKSNQIKSNQIKSNQIKSNQIKSNQIKSNQIKSNQIKSNQIKSNQIKSNQIKSNQIKSNQIKSNQIKSNQIKSNQIKSNQIKSNQIKSHVFFLISGILFAHKKKLLCFKNAMKNSILSNQITSITRIFFVSLFLLFWNVSYSQTLISLTDFFHSTHLKFNAISILEDPSHSLTFEDIEGSDQFVENQEQIPNFGFTKSVYWLKIKLINHSDYQQWVIKIKYPPINKISLYMRDKDGTVKVTNQGVSVPWTNHRIAYRYPIFTPFFQKQKAFHIYFRVETGTSLQIPIEISNINRFIKNNQHRRKVFWSLLWDIIFDPCF